MDPNDNEQGNQTADLEAYRQLSLQARHENEEKYWIHRLFFLGCGALIMAIGIAPDNGAFLILAGLLGSVVTISWRLSIRAQERWKDWFTAELAITERRLFRDGPWQKIVYRHVWDGDADGSLLGTLGIPEQSQVRNPAPSMDSVDNVLHALCYVLLAVYLSVAAYGVILVLSATG